ncbi:MAG TPA: hypothetical protein VMS71_04445 [Candidatus Acidoferrum sp.]|nr:hypothetical protein [Candidatus Acidoferrum sp.]
MKRISRSIQGAAFVLALLISPFAFGQQTQPAHPQGTPGPNHPPMIDTVPKPVAVIPQVDTTAGWFVIETTHRIFTNFLQVDTVFFGQPFALGEDEKDTAYVFGFNPDFSINFSGADSGKVIQVSDTLRNPAAHLMVVNGGRLQQESWAFKFGGAPHFRRNAFFAFRMLEYRVPDKYIKAPDAK